jgi:riboflavin biosynthesis pyrimidine reductase
MGLAPFEVLVEGDTPSFELPPDLERIYGRLGFAPQVLYANFVASIDGVVALGPTPSAGSVISGRDPADRFLMGLLRACADAVVLGAATLRATPGHLWTPGHVAPAFSEPFAALRATLGRAPEPRLVLFTARGDVDLDHVAIQHGATVVTTEAQAGALRRRLPESCDVIAVGSGERVDVRSAVGELRSRGYETLLTEGGPHLTGELLRSGSLDEIFLTISPVIAGRGEQQRLGMVAGVELLPAAGAWTRLVSARRHSDYLFLRYSLRDS